MQVGFSDITNLILIFKVIYYRNKQSLRNILNFVWMNLELIFWIAALVILFVIEPSQVHFTLCPISNLGFDFCPGCGLGHSIHYALRINFEESFMSHPLGIIAIFILFQRIITLFYNNILKPYKYGNKSFTTYSGY